MAMTVREIRQWLSHLEAEDEICIDDGGLAIQLVDDPGVYLEVGGDPRFNEDPVEDETPGQDDDKYIVLD